MLTDYMHGRLVHDDEGSHIYLQADDVVEWLVELGLPNAARGLVRIVEFMETQA